jgi:valyl-tRNA synthetase
MELAKTYDPKAVEQDVYAAWQQAGAFEAEAADGEKTFCIVIPPPNVTDRLHVGHALNNTLQDVLIRWRRMQQYRTLWMPGTDHAGIATQTKVEKRLQAEEGRRRTDLGREAFVARVQAWKDEYEATILGQLRLIGCSCDWRRTRFTMDAVCARALREAFFRLFADGLIYRGKRLVNWDPATQTVLADDEVEHQTVQDHFWYLRYPLAEPVAVPAGAADARGTGEAVIDHVTVATTRPETMLGDTAVAVNPRDPRAGALVGRHVRLPLVGRIIPIVADETVVLPNRDSDDEKARFSTGFLKVTPAHDPVDWEIGQRHGLDAVNVLAPDGTISDRHGWDDAKGTDAEQLLGLDRFEAREAIVEWFRQENLLEEVREYAHEIGHSYRSHVPVEPYLSDQWYVAVKQPVPTRPDEGPLDGTDVPASSLAGLALAPLLDGRLRFIPHRYARTYQSWLENLRDWPISRQLWWGHRIPVWSKDLERPADVAPEPTGRGPDAQVCAALDRCVGGRWDQHFAGGGRYHLRVDDHPDRPGWIRAHVCPGPGADGVEAKLQAAGFVQDADVLDTWFSSALWPFSTMGWPERTAELEAFYPGDVLVTAREIITLWVSRMVMMGQYALGEAPFAEVFIHAMIQDGDGRKMSKSLGNGIDPLDIVDSHGADALRFTLVSMTTQTQDVRMPVESVQLPDGRTANTSPKFDIGRNFCNKLWNASRFALMNLAGCPAWSQIDPRAALSDRWVLSRLNVAVGAVTAALGAYRFNDVADALYHFTWDDVCDWYVEIAKERIRAGEVAPKAVLAHCLDVILRLLHPVIPFITEAIWWRLNEVAPRRGPAGGEAEPLLARAQWPATDAAFADEQAEADFALLQDLVRQIRNVRTQHAVPPGRRVDAIAEAGGGTADVLAADLDLVRSQARVGHLTIAAGPIQPPADAAAVTAGDAKLFVLGIVDRQAEARRLRKQADALAAAVRAIEGKLANEGFRTKAPRDVVERERRRLEAAQADLAAVRDALEALG